MTKQKQPTSHLFTVRLWPEALGDDQLEWRGELTHVLSGEVAYFRNWSRLVELLDKRLPESSAAMDESEEN